MFGDANCINHAFLLIFLICDVTFGLTTEMNVQPTTVCWLAVKMQFL